MVEICVLHREWRVHFKNSRKKNWIMSGINPIKKKINNPLQEGHIEYYEGGVLNNIIK